MNLSPECYAQVRGSAAQTSVAPAVQTSSRSGATSYFYGGDYADNTTLPVFKEVEVAAVIPAATPDGWDEMSAVTGRVFVAQTPETFEYDADGNMTSDGRFSYVWNAENRLIRAQELYAPTNRAPYTVTYAYDHRGRMVSKRIYDSALKMLALPNHPTTQPPSGGCVCRVIGISSGGYAACIGFSRRDIGASLGSGYPETSAACRAPIIPQQYPDIPKSRQLDNLDKFE